MLFLDFGLLDFGLVLLELGHVSKREGGMTQMSEEEKNVVLLRLEKNVP